MGDTAIDHWGDISEVANRLAGSWRFDRVIDGQGTVQGIATFTALDGDSLAYREQGQLRLLDGTEFQTEREYIFASNTAGFQVFFKETPPRLFHEITLSASTDGVLSGGADHLCNLDSYRSSYAFLPDGRFVIRHIVEGPRKDYTMTTTYVRT